VKTSAQQSISFRVSCVEKEHLHLPSPCSWIGQRYSMIISRTPMLLNIDNDIRYRWKRNNRSRANRRFCFWLTSADSPRLSSWETEREREPNSNLLAVHNSGTYSHSEVAFDAFSTRSVALRFSKTPLLNILFDRTRALLAEELLVSTSRQNPIFQGDILSSKHGDMRWDSLHCVYRCIEPCTSPRFIGIALHITPILIPECAQVRKVK